MKPTYSLPKNDEFRSISNPRSLKRTVMVRKTVGQRTDRNIERDHELYSSDPDENPLKKE